jgi:hypothetical protein
MEATKRVFKKRPRVAQVLPTQCLACDAEAGYRLAPKVTQVDLKGETFAVSHEALECPACGHTILSDAQLDARVRKTVAAYQTKHGLLTAVEVATRRKALGHATQQALADSAPTIAIATLKRVEAGQHVQDPGTDFILRKTLEILESTRAQAAMFALLRGTLTVSPETEITTRTSGAMVGLSWRGTGSAALPLAACLTVVASSNSPRFTPQTLPPMEVASGC